MAGIAGQHRAVPAPAQLQPQAPGVRTRRDQRWRSHTHRRSQHKSGERAGGPLCPQTSRGGGGAGAGTSLSRNLCLGVMEKALMSPQPMGCLHQGVCTGDFFT